METFKFMQRIIMKKHSYQINTLWWNKEKGSRLTDRAKKTQVEPRRVQLQISIRHKSTDLSLNQRRHRVWGLTHRQMLISMFDHLQHRLS